MAVEDLALKRKAEQLGVVLSEIMIGDAIEESQLLNLLGIAQNDQPKKTIALPTNSRRKAVPSLGAHCRRSRRT